MSVPTWGVDEPETTSRKTDSHYCRAVESTMYVRRGACPYCSAGTEGGQ
ncbi:hypothetical protein HSRCO_2893 [Halanaeroarchaeum sp. HSR-CO]|nr:hypothetical protein HSRCO_2893 [Halanaeroarchaeum sp. HSR-CO]